MKNIIYSFLIIGILLSGCDLNEDPPFLSNISVYSTADNARAALNGALSGAVEYDLFGNQFYIVNGMYSGMMVSRRAGNNANTIYNTTLGSLIGPSGEINSGRVWQQVYRTIGRNNDVIASAIVTPDPQTDDELVINDVIGISYFLRAFLYFELVNFYGELPLRLAPTTTETIHMAKSTRKEIYEQIIADAEMALLLMNGSAGGEYPRSYAVNMLLAKVYMNLATAPDEWKDPSLNYWQAAYDEAIKLYGQYSLVSDYASLFNEATSDGTAESIFELQSSDEASHDWVRSFTPNWYTQANTFGWLQVNADVYDQHANTYPGDPRLAATYLSSWVRQNNGATFNTYPSSARGSFGNAHPFFFKLSEKDPSNTTRVGNQNIILYRYADLLLMLAEISNELQNGEQLGYITEVLDRVGQTPQAGYLGSQSEFRESIMREYQFELLGEGHDITNTRRRGYTWLKDNIIDPHNSNPSFNPNLDVTFSEDESLVMNLMTPIEEINKNQLINN